MELELKTENTIYVAQVPTQYPSKRPSWHPWTSQLVGATFSPSTFAETLSLSLLKSVCNIARNEQNETGRLVVMVGRKSDFLLAKCNVRHGTFRMFRICRDLSKIRLRFPSFYFFVGSKTLSSGCRLSVFYWIFAFFLCYFR